VAASREQAVADAQRALVAAREQAPAAAQTAEARSLGRSGILSAVGLSLAGFTGILKDPAQATLKRLCQNAYTDLVAIAVQTAPPPQKSKIQQAISRRRLTPATPS
jgi:hypothetical protein